MASIISGLLIGFVNNSWTERIGASFIWGVVIMVYTAIVEQNKRDIFIINAEKHNKKAKFGISHKQAFYFIEYMTASSTALVFSILAGVIKILF
ncbi:MAG: hypothetical protein V1655_04305 [bacterium]